MNENEMNKENLLYFENPTMKGLFKEMKLWQGKNKKRLLSTSIEKDGDNFCCIALSNPTEVTIVDSQGKNLATPYGVEVYVQGGSVSVD
tara:strand:- start:290 stop:556 length:267 start_codon:yes stop_codon:yes gene_type:complete